MVRLLFPAHVSGVERIKHWLPVLFLFAGLGSSFSFGQVKQQSDPFSRYLDGIKENQPETALIRFARECSVNIANAKPRFAVGAGSSITPVKDIARGLRSLETDFYSTSQTWVEGGRVLLEAWANSDDVGSEVRYFECFSKSRLMQAEVILWNVPLVQSASIRSWGYSRRWERKVDGPLQRTKAEFVDGMERTIPAPKLDENGKKSLLWIPPLGPLSELHLPSALLR